MFDSFQEDVSENDTSEEYAALLSNDESREVVKNFVKECIECFFIDKQYCCGGSIPKYILYHDQNVDMVMRTMIADGVDMVHKSLEKFCDLDESSKKIIDVLNKCANRWIPKEFAAGLMIMYFRLCEGLTVG